MYGTVGTPEGGVEPAHVDSIPPILHSVPAETQQAREQQQQQLQQQQQQDEVDTSSNDEDRHNFALSKDGAKIVACNKEAKKCSAILDTDSDTFMKNDCRADKWFIMELSQVSFLT